MRVALKIGALPRPQAGRLDTAAMAYRNAFPTTTAPDAWLPGGLPAVPVDMAVGGNPPPRAGRLERRPSRLTPVTSAALRRISR